MTKITLMARNGMYIGFSVEGHSGYAKKGSDIVCAAVSAAVQLVECQLTDVLALAADVEIDEDRAAVQFTLTSESDLIPAQPALRAFALAARQWEKDYPKSITVQEDAS